MTSVRKAKTRILTSRAEMRKAVAAARRCEKVATKIRHARYDAKGYVIIVELSTGSVLTVPRRIIPGFARGRRLPISRLLPAARAFGRHAPGHNPAGEPLGLLLGCRRGARLVVNVPLNSLRLYLLKIRIVRHWHHRAVTRVVV